LSSIAHQLGAPLFGGCITVDTAMGVSPTTSAAWPRWRRQGEKVKLVTNFVDRCNTEAETILHVRSLRVCSLREK
jgi:hypothetical protein